jgi:regulator of nucleoside diphosphate kinase
MSKTHVITETDLQRLNTLAKLPQTRAENPGVVFELKKELGRGEVVAPTAVARDTVTMNSRVRVRPDGSRRGEVYTLVYPEEADFEAGKLSVLSPLGRALLGAREGDSVEVDAPAGVRTFKVEKVLYQPEAAGDFHL